MSKISYSAWSKFMLCPSMYDIHYNKDLEPEQTTSSLMFGSAIDTALNELYKSNANPVDVFKENFKYEQMESVVFHRKDLSRSIFTQSQLEDINGKDDQYVSWAALRVRGRVLLEHYMETVFPMITKVVGVQKELNGRKGFTDLIAHVNNSDKPILIDHKCSYYEYSQEAASTGPQLALYANEEGIEDVAYCVLLKDIRTSKMKRCIKCGNETNSSHKTCNKETDGGRCHGNWEFEVVYHPAIQWIQGRPSEHMKETMIDSIRAAEELIELYNSKNRNYPRNYSTCDFVYGRKCEYYNFCHYKNETGLTKRRKK